MLDSPTTEPIAPGRALAEEILAALARFDGDGRLLSANAGFARVFGREVAPGEPADALELRPSPGTRPAPITRALAGERIAGEDFIVSRPDGSTRWVRLSAGPVSASDDVGTGAWAVLVEVGEQRPLEGLREQILGVVAHDLRNPMSAMRMTLAMLAKPAEVTTERRLALSERLLGTLGRMEGLVNTLAEHARAELGVATRITRARADMGDVYERAAAELQVLHPNRAVTVRREGDLAGYWDAARLERVLVALLGNALKHGSDATPVSVVMDGADAQRVVVTVHNDGAPIPPEVLPLVFEPFTTGSYDKQGRRRGIGLGLHIAGLLVSAHGGALTLDSSAGAGTTATVTLPRVAPRS
jgi:PAS domain S-box-containing protein